jgi:hypothetical protein
MRDLIPSRELDFVLWLEWFVSEVSEHAAPLGLDENDVNAIREPAEAFQEAFQEASCPDTRTSIAVRIKNEKRRAAERVCRSYLQRIKRDPDVCVYRKIGMGFDIPQKSRLKIKNRSAPSASLR